MGKFTSSNLRLRIWDGATCMFISNQVPHNCWAQNNLRSVCKLSNNQETNIYSHLCFDHQTALQVCFFSVVVAICFSSINPANDKYTAF